MHERRNIRLSAADRRELEAVVANRNSPQKQVWRAKIVLLTADGCGTAEIMQATGKAKTVIWRWQERFRDHGATELWRDKTRPSGIPPLSPEVAERVVAIAGWTAAGSKPLDRLGHGQRKAANNPQRNPLAALSGIFDHVIEGQPERDMILQPYVSLSPRRGSLESPEICMTSARLGRDIDVQIGQRLREP
jgi:hypothetical protein